MFRDININARNLRSSATYFKTDSTVFYAKCYEFKVIEWLYAVHMQPTGCMQYTLAAFPSGQWINPLSESLSKAIES